MHIQNISRCLLYIYAMAIAVIMFKSGSPDALYWYVLALPFFAWAVGHQYIFFRYLPRISNDNGKIIWVIIQGLLFAASLQGYYKSLFETVDPQSGFAFLFIPLFMYLFTFPLIIAHKVGKFMLTRRGSN